MRKRLLVSSAISILMAAMFVGSGTGDVVLAHSNISTKAPQDASYVNAIKNGVVLGIYPASPYTFIDPNTKKPTGVDWDIVTTALHRIGISKYSSSMMPWDSLIPALQSKRIDIITGDIQTTPARLKIIGFTGPAWWYGPAVIVQKGNPNHISSFQDLSKSGITVGTVEGSNDQEYLNYIHAKVITYQDSVSEFTSLEVGRETAVLEDDPIFAAFKSASSKSNLEKLNIPTPSAMVTDYGYGYARYGLRKSDQSLTNKLTQALMKMRADGTMLKILKKWGLSSANLNIPH